MHESGQEETDDIGTPSSCSSPGEKSYNGEDWSYSLDLIDEYALDDEVGKRLNQMVPVPVSIASDEIRHLVFKIDLHLELEVLHFGVMVHISIEPWFFQVEGLGTTSSCCNIPV